MESTILQTHGSRVGHLVSHSSDVEIRLAAKDLFKMEGDVRGTLITSTCGSLWVTQEGDAQDYLLEEGEKMVISRKGMVLVEGSPEARARILPHAA